MGHGGRDGESRRVDGKAVHLDLDPDWKGGEMSVALFPFFFFFFFFRYKIENENSRPKPFYVPGVEFFSFFHCSLHEKGLLPSSS